MNLNLFLLQTCVVYNIEKGVTCLILPFKTKRSGVCVVCNKFQVYYSIYHTFRKSCTVIS